MSVQEYCTQSPGAYKNNNCARNPGRVIAVHFIKDTVYPLSWEDDSAWGTAQDAGNVKSIYKTKGEKPKAEPSTQDGFGKLTVTTTNRTFNLTYMHRGIGEKDGSDNFQNRDFYNLLNQDEGNWYVAFVTGDDTGYYSNVTVNVDADVVVPENILEEVLFDVAVQWQQIDLLEMFDAPATAIDATG